MEFERPKWTPDEIKEKTSKHQLKMTEDVLANEVNKAKEMVKNFAWNEAGEEKEGIETYECSDQEIDSCAEAVTNYLAEHLTIEEMDPVSNDDTTGVMVHCEIPLAIHAILKNRYNKRWSFKSRLEAIDRVRASLESVVLHPKIREKLTMRLQTVLPTARAVWEVVSVNLDDDEIIINNQTPEKKIIATVEIGKQHVG